MDTTPVYRDLQADYAGKHFGDPCDHCTRPIREEAYSFTNGEKYCTKRCALAHQDPEKTK